MRYVLVVSTQYLIDALVQQTTVLLAQLATAGGIRAPLAHIAEQVFLELARELENQGVSRKVTADMFGLALRTYQRRTQRLRESAPERGRSLWEALYAFIRTKDVVTREQVLHRFRNDDAALVKGVLHDLTENGLVFASGNGPTTAYRAVSGDELGTLRALSAAGGLEAMLWARIYSEGPLHRDQLLVTGVRGEELDAALGQLLEQGRIEAEPSDAGPRYHSQRLFIPLDAGASWEGAVLDHFRALVSTIGARLRLPPGSPEAERVGGSTYTLEIWPGHPLEAEVLGSLSRFRAAQTELRERLDAYNASASASAPAERVRVLSYAGQCVMDEQEGDEER